MCWGSETKAQDEQVREALFELSGEWHIHSSSAVKKGYSGTAILSRQEPVAVTHGIGVDGMDDEGRVTAADFGTFHFVTVYTPNSSSGLKRFPFRKEWDVAFRDYLIGLSQDKPVIINLWRPQCGPSGHRPRPSRCELQQDAGLHPG